MHKIIIDYTPVHILQFLASARCCKQLNGTFNVDERNLIVKAASSYGLRVQHKRMNGVFFLSISKRSCLHYMESATSVSLQPSVSLQLQKVLERSTFVTHHASINISGFHTVAQKHVPFITQTDFPFKQDCPRAVASMQGIEYLSMVKPDTKRIILDMVSALRVTVLNSKFDDFATIVPHLLLAEAKLKLTVFRMLVVQVHEVLASYNSERVASYWGEKLGKTVACQYGKHSCINEDSSIIYTTYDYLLRTLMGKCQLNNFQHITYVVLAEAHLQKANTHLLLRELREALKYHVNLKIIILSNSDDSAIFTSYFNEGHTLSISSGVKNSSPAPIQADTIYIADVRELVESERVKPNHEKFLMSVAAPKVSSENLTNVAGMDSCLDAYATAADAVALEALALFVNLENEDINYQHSTTGVTALILAASRCKADHLRFLLENGADPFLHDNMGRNAISLACARGDVLCMDIINQHCRVTISRKDNDADFVDIELITNLIQIVANDWAQGNVLVFLPKYEHMLQVQYRLLRQRHLGQMAQTVDIHLLHEKSTQNDCEELTNPLNKKTRIILSNTVAEQFTFNFPFAYVIDTARRCIDVFDQNEGHRDLIYKFVSKDCLERRRAKADTEKCEYNMNQ